MKYRVRALTLRDCGRWHYDDCLTEYFETLDGAIYYFELMCKDNFSPEVATQEKGEYSMLLKWLPGVKKIYQKGEI